MCVTKLWVWKIACDQVVCVSKIVCDKLYSLPPDAAWAHCTLLSTTHETNQNCSRSCDLKASRWTLPWHVADCFIYADHRHVPGKAIAVAVIFGWKPSVGPKHTRPRHPAPPANEVTVTADNTSVCVGQEHMYSARHLNDARSKLPAKTFWMQVKQRRMSPSATPTTQNESGCRQVPRLPREKKVDVA